jgi:hypothetical protein
MTRKNSLLILVLIALLTSCNLSKMTFGNADKWVPSNFEPSKCTLLIQTFDISDKTQKKIEAYMLEKYPYKFEFASIKEIMNKTGKYSDLKKYKFAIIYESHFSSWQQAGKAGGVQSSSVDYNFVDRETEKFYPPTKKANSYAIMTFKPMINTIVKRFE